MIISILQKNCIFSSLLVQVKNILMLLTNIYGFKLLLLAISPTF